MEQHKAWCRHKAFQHSDAAKRLRDTYNLHRIGDVYGSVGKWFAVALVDGRSDGVLYDSKHDAVRHQHHNEQWYAFVKIVPTTMHLCEAEVYLTTARNVYDAGLRMTDPDHRHGGPDLIKRITVEDTLALSHGFVTNLEMPH